MHATGEENASVLINSEERNWSTAGATVLTCGNFHLTCCYHSHNIIHHHFITSFIASLHLFISSLHQSYHLNSSIASPRILSSISSPRILSSISSLRFPSSISSSCRWRPDEWRHGDFSLAAIYLHRTSRPGVLKVTLVVPCWKMMLLESWPSIHPTNFPVPSADGM